MIEKTITKGSLSDPLLSEADLAYWLDCSPEERLAAVDYLRRQWHGNTDRLQRTVRVIKLAQS